MVAGGAQVVDDLGLERARRERLRVQRADPLVVGGGLRADHSSYWASPAPRTTRSPTRAASVIGVSGSLVANSALATVRPPNAPASARTASLRWSIVPIGAASSPVSRSMSMAEAGVGRSSGSGLGGVSRPTLCERGDVLAVGDLGVQELVDLDHQRLLAGAVEDHHHALGVRAPCWKARAVAIAMSVASSMGVTRRRRRPAGLDLVPVGGVAVAQVAPPHTEPMVLVLPHVAQLVRDQARRALVQRALDEDQRAHLVAVEAPEPGEPEQPRDVQDAHVGDVHGLGIEVEPVEGGLGAPQRGALLRGPSEGQGSISGAMYAVISSAASVSGSVGVAAWRAAACCAASSSTPVPTRSW